jgi:hypothetical protein
MLVLLLSCFPYLSVGSSLITLKYYKDSDCSANIYGVGAYLTLIIKLSPSLPSTIFLQA